MGVPGKIQIQLPKNSNHLCICNATDVAKLSNLLLPGLNFAVYTSRSTLFSLCAPDTSQYWSYMQCSLQSPVDSLSLTLHWDLPSVHTCTCRIHVCICVLRGTYMYMYMTNVHYMCMCVHTCVGSVSCHWSWHPVQCGQWPQPALMAHRLPGGDWSCQGMANTLLHT